MKESAIRRHVRKVLKEWATTQQLVEDSLITIDKEDETEESEKED